MKWGLVWCFVFFTSLLYAQTAREMDLLLETREVSFDQASRFVLVVANVMTNEGADTGTAYDLALERGWLPKNVEAGRPIRLGELCSLIMGAFEIKGSFLYTLFPGSRYAFRELDYLKLIPGQRDPALKVSGERFLQILGMVAAYTKVEEKAAEEEARRRAAEEAQRLAAEETQRLAAAEEARRLAAAEEARRLAAAEEARRLAAAEEARRLAATEEARRLAAAEEARRLAAAEEARQSSEIETRRALADAAAVKSVRIQFSPDRTELTEAEKAKIREIVPLLLRYPGRRILVEGYTALAGNEAGRLRISTERAQAVADFLVSLNVRRAGEISVRGYGAQRPVGNNATAAGRTMNRRVEITLLDE